MNELTLTSLEFENRNCKLGKHYSCAGRWQGLGFNFNCLCHCHKKQGHGASLDGYKTELAPHFEVNQDSGDDPSG